MSEAKTAALSSTVKKVLADFKTTKSSLALTKPKLKAWYETLATLAAPKRGKTAAELLTVALRFERDGGPESAEGAAQLYYLASAALSQTAAKAKGWSKK